MNTQEQVLMLRVLELARKGLEQSGTKPFAAVVVRNGVIVGEGLNRADGKMDPTSHGEVEAIRDACNRLGTLNLAGCTLYTSCEPCSMCVATMKLAGISRLYFGASLHSAGKAMAAIQPDLVSRNTEMREEVGKPIGERTLPAQQLLAEEADSILRIWSARISGR